MTHIMQDKLGLNKGDSRLVTDHKPMTYKKESKLIKTRMTKIEVGPRPNGESTFLCLSSQVIEVQGSRIVLPTKDELVFTS